MAKQPIFKPTVLQQLGRRHEQTFRQLAEIEDELNQRFAYMEEAVRGLILAVITKEPLLFVGPPGTAKSRLIRAFCSYLGIDVTDDDDSTSDYFEYLLTPFTEPGELFGYFDVEALWNNKRFEKPTEGVIQAARVIYLDEVFNASSAILNSLLTLINEGWVHDRNRRIQAQWQCLFAATNHTPTTDALKAVYDRFLLRCEVENVDVRQGPEQLQTLLRAGWPETYGEATPSAVYTDMLDKIVEFRDDVRQEMASDRLHLNPHASFYQDLNQVVDVIRRHHLSEMSNRRMVKMLFVMMVHAIYEAVREERLDQGVTLGSGELQLLETYALDQRDEFVTPKLRAVYSLHASDGSRL